MSEHEEHRYDVVIVGAGGAGLRAAIAAREAGLRTAIVCKSLFGKAHTVMAEGGIAASMGNANSHDNWQVHFRDTMRGGALSKPLLNARRFSRYTRCSARCRIHITWPSHLVDLLN